VYDDPEPELVDEFANVISRNRFELAPSLSLLLRSEILYSPRAYRALVKSPVEFAIGAHKQLGLTEIAAGTPAALRAMGQILFHPPNVAGWPGGANWLTSQMLIARENFIARMVDEQVTTESDWVAQVPMDASRASREIVSTVLQNDAPRQAGDQLVAYLNGAGTFGQRVRGAIYLAMASPAYQLG